MSMTKLGNGNPQRGQLGFEVDGTHWVFAFTTNALCVVEEEFGLSNISELETVLGEKPSLITIRKLFRIGLTDCNPDMTDFEAGRIMQAVGGLEEALQLVMLAIETAFPEAAKGGNPDPRKPAPKAPSGRGIGRASTSRGAKAG